MHTVHTCGFVLPFTGGGVLPARECSQIADRGCILTPGDFFFGGGGCHGLGGT